MSGKKPSLSKLIRTVDALRGEVAQMRAENGALRTENAELRRENAKLRNRIKRLKKTSGNSSKPPSSDIVKKSGGKKSGDQKQSEKRKRGGQAGHARHQRPDFPPEQVDRVVDHAPDSCPDCGGALEPDGDPARVVQQVELVEKPFVVTEHRAGSGRCPNCGKVHAGSIPADIVRGGLAGPRLTAWIAELKAEGHVSYSGIQTILRDVFGLKLSTGYLAKIVQRTSDALKEAYDELSGKLASEPVLNVDETGHRNLGIRYWTWCFRAANYSFFKIDKSRGSKVLFEVLGDDFIGTLVSDLFSAYLKFARENGHSTQFCHAHLIRDLKFLAESDDAEVSMYAKILLRSIRDLFDVLHDDSIDESERRLRLERIARETYSIGKSGAPDRPGAAAMRSRFEKVGQDYFTFVSDPSVPPTNNAAEQAIRTPVLDRKVTQGTRGEAGMRWSERIWTAAATCRQRGVSLFDFLQRSIRAFLRDEPAPSLLFP
jgi:transposase/regulator of replication initiation timing